MNTTDLQQLLSVLGYAPGRLDGRVGPMTRTALHAFQADQSLVRSDDVDDVTAARLLDVDAAQRSLALKEAPTMEEVHEMLRRRGRRLPDPSLYPSLLVAMAQYGIGATIDRSAAFLAQLFHESGGLRYMEEIADGSAYEGRADLGNTEPGDGRRYKGRGPIQLTGRANYRRFGELLGRPLEEHPELVKSPDVGFQVAALYWTDRNLNARMDEPSSSEARLRAVTLAINGGLNHIDDRRAWLRVCWSVLMR